ncbi:MAG: RNA polymerase sigma factor [Planctomycetota bacterium]
MMNPSDDDSTLFAAIAEGDMDAFQELVGRYNNRIIGFLTRFLNDHERAMDLAQDTFLKLFKRLREQDRVVREGCGSALIFTIAANLGRDELRRRKVRKEVALGDTVQFHASSQPTPSTIVARKQQHEEVESTLAELDDDVRELLVLREVEGLSYDEIAVIQRVPLGTVKSRINRARLTFKNTYFARQKRKAIQVVV